MKRSQLLAVSLSAAVIATGGVVASGMLAKRFATAPPTPGGDQFVTVSAGTDGTAATIRTDGKGALYAAPSFSLTDQSGRPFGTEQLKGKTWIAMLFFTECKAACPMMAGRMRDIQSAVNDPNIDLVSITVDPLRDTPAVLGSYAKKYNADGKRWFFLTGTPADVQTAADGLHLNAEVPTDGTPPAHSEKFLLIDKSGNVRGVYSTNDDASMKQLAVDAKVLSAE